MAGALRLDTDRDRPPHLVKPTSSRATGGSRDICPEQNRTAPLLRREKGLDEPAVGWPLPDSQHLLPTLDTALVSMGEAGPGQQKVLFPGDPVRLSPNAGSQAPRKGPAPGAPGGCSPPSRPRPHIPSPSSLDSGPNCGMWGHLHFKDITSKLYHLREGELALKPCSLA